MTDHPEHQPWPWPEPTCRRIVARADMARWCKANAANGPL